MKVEFINVFKAFDGKQILRDLNLLIDSSERITIIGPSGSGKSTILKLLLGLIPVDSGQILVDDVDISSLSVNELSLVRAKIGLLFQSAALFDSLTVLENVQFPLTENSTRLNDSEVKHRVREALELVEMTGFENEFPASLSGGQRKRIGLARALVMRPEVLVYDEPTTGLDPVLSTNIENLINKMALELNITSITVTHQISTILRTSEKIYFLDNGSLCPAENPDTIFSSPNNKIRRFIKGNLE